MNEWNHTSMSTTPLVILLFLLLIKCNPLEACLPRFIEEKITVVVDRNVSSDAIPMKVHCFSKDDDLGYHMLLKFNDYFKWKFCLNFIPTTKFFCHIWWGNKTQKFNAYNENLDSNPNYQIWLAADDGIYLAHAPFQRGKKMYDWNTIWCFSWLNNW